MNTQARRVVHAILLMIIVQLGGCTKDPTEIIPVDNNDGMICISVMSEPMGEETMQTRADDNGLETTVENLWIIPMSSNDQIAGIPIYVESLSSSEGSYSVSLQLSSSAQYIIAIANTNDQTLFKNVVTLEDISSVSRAFRQTGGPLPMAGSSEITDGNCDIKLRIACAKLTFKLAVDLPAGHKFDLSYISVYGPPFEIVYYRDENSLYPTGLDDIYPKDFDMQYLYNLTPAEKTFSATPIDCGTVYLPECAYGIGSGTTQKEKDAMHCLGLGNEWVGGHASHIVMYGKYFNGSDWWNVFYKIYLGRNAINDYNVIRGTHYTVISTIKGIDFTDTRVSSSCATGFYDYTSNLSGRLVVATYDVSDNASIAEARTLCETKMGSSWHLPELKEMNLIAAMQAWNTASEYGFVTNAPYWTSTSSSSTDNYVFSWPGTVSSSNGTARVRCIKRL